MMGRLIAVIGGLEFPVAYLVVPGVAGTNQAEVWIGGLGESTPASATLVVGRERSERLTDWRSWGSADQASSVIYWRLTVADLSPGTTYEVALLIDGVAVSRASLRTLPSELPSLADRPFTALLGSCFAASQDLSGSVGGTYAHLPVGLRPDVKFLCGDQVYLDSPWSHFLWHTHHPQELAGEFLANYARAWTQSGMASGFRELLSRGANYFTSDDHDFWNNAPSAGVYARDTWTSSGREAWLGVARDLYGIFQSPARSRQFDVGGLSFLITDTRIDRQADRSQFMSDEELRRVTEWLGDLGGPGVLVMGQSVLASKAGFWGLAGYVGDWGLPDFRQYQDLLGAILTVRHSLVLLTGDVHFGRVSTARLASGNELVEIISSPMALVDPLAKGKRQVAPPRVPTSVIAGIGTVQTSTRPFGPFDGADNHFVTLEFAQDGHKVSMNTKVWPIELGGQPAQPRLADHRLLQ
jgi:hypothetical protein